MIWKVDFDPQAEKELDRRLMGSGFYYFFTIDWPEVQHHLGRDDEKEKDVVAAARNIQKLLDLS